MVLNSILVVLWLASLAFYWVLAPVSDPNRHWLAGLLLSYLLLWSAGFVWSNAPKAELGKRFLLTSASITFMVGISEGLVLATIFDFRTIFGTPVFEPWAHPGNLLDPQLLHFHKPYDRFRWGRIDYRYDRHGLRNESDLEAADVVVVGDSFIEGLGVSAADLLTAHLAQQLGRSVANVAQSWYGPQQELGLLQRYGVRLLPKVCVGLL